MATWRTAVAAAAIVIAPACLLLAEPNPNGNKPIAILLAAGDVAHCGNSDEAKMASKTAQVIKTQIDEAKKNNPAAPVRVLVLGDLAYETGTPQELNCFKQRWGAFYDILLPAPGNHEYESTNLDGKPYFKHFAKHPLVNQNGKMKGYYTLTLPDQNGPWRLFALNAYAGGRGDQFAKQHQEAMKTQMAWLEKNLDPTKKANSQNCVLAFWHPPLLSSGFHGHDDKKNPEALVTKSRPMRDAFRILYRYGATVVLAGHDHNYEQFLPHDGDDGAANDGLRSFVVGTGGTDLYRYVVYSHPAPNSEDYTQDVHGILRLNLYPDRYTWEFLPVDGQAPLALKSKSANCNPRKKPA